MACKSFGHRHPLGRSKRINSVAAKRELLGAGCVRRQRQDGRAVLHQRLVRLMCAVPLDEG